MVTAAVDLGISESGAGIVLFAGSAVSILVRVTVGHLTDRVRGRGFGAWALLTGIGAVIFFLMPLGTGSGFALLVIAAFASGWAWPGLMTFSVVHANPGSVAASSSIAQAGVFVGAGAGPIVLGWIAQTRSFDAVWLVVGTALAASTIVVGAVGRSPRRPPTVVG